MQSFSRLAKLKAHFKDQYNEKLNTEDQIFKPQSNKIWTPNKIHQTVEIYIKATEGELKQQGDISSHKGYSNLSKGERIAMKELSDHTDIIITKADKAGAVVIMDVKDYISKAHRQLNNKDHYKILHNNPTTTNANLVNDTMQRFKNEKLRKEKIADGLKCESQKIQNSICSQKFIKMITLVDQ